MQGAWYNFEHKNINGRCVHIMIFIETALAIEAAPLIEHFKLKKDMYVHACPVTEMLGWHLLQEV